MKNYQRRIIGILTLCGSSVGIVSSLTQLIEVNGVIGTMVFGLVLAIYSWGAWLGLNLLENKPNFQQLIKFWWLQVPIFWSPLLGYFLTSGFHLSVYFDFSAIKLIWNFNLGSLFKFTLLQSGHSWQLGVNIFALGVVWFLDKQVTSTKAVNVVASE